MHRYPIRADRIFEAGLPDNSDFEEPDAASSPGPRSSSPMSAISESNEGIPFKALPEQNDDDENDLDWDAALRVSNKRRAGLNDIEKTRLVLEFMSEHLNKFSFRKFLVTAFTSDDATIKHSANIFLSDDSHIELMDNWWQKRGGLKPKQFGLNATNNWVISKAAEICDKEASWLTDRASQGPFVNDANFLRLSPSNVTVEKVNEFRIYDLLGQYERVTPNLQQILKAVIAKEECDPNSSTRNPDAGRTQVTSMLLNLRSRSTNYHPIVNSLIFWDGRVSKRLNQAFNNLGVTASFQSQARAITVLSRDAVRKAREAANDPSKIIMLPYDNFNWTSHAWEVSAGHGSKSHDEVSALLVVLEKSEGHTAAEITSVAAFKKCAGTRHNIPPTKSLSDIMPSAPDHLAFRENVLLHVASILTEEIQVLAQFSKSIPVFKDAQATPPRKTEEYYLPTFDQEQGSTRGNMVVLEHYFGEVLKIPKETFESRMFTVLGDRLTTARDRAAQDQRAIDRSKFRFDHLSSFVMTSGLMHFCLNFIQAIGNNAWGESNGRDSVSLSTLQKLLPNRSDNVQLRKIDYYAWLRFLEVVLKSLVLQASMKILGVSTLEELSSRVASFGLTRLLEHAKSIATFCLQSPERLEATRTKKILGESETGHALLLFRDLMTLREMQHAIKHGHPGRILRMIKFWMPMFYAAGSYNYANECMELLHNIHHDWPRDFSNVALKGMLVNPSGRPDGSKPTDIRVEHLNDRIKERAHGSNATPDVLEKTTPAMGHVQNLTDQLFDDLGVEKQNQAHAHVHEHNDVQILTEHFSKANIFKLDEDKPSTSKVLDLFISGSHRLAGGKGGHASHLKRHAQRLRMRHDDCGMEGMGPEASEQSLSVEEYTIADPEVNGNELSDILRIAHMSILEDD